MRATIAVLTGVLLAATSAWFAYKPLTEASVWLMGMLPGPLSGLRVRAAIYTGMLGVIPAIGSTLMYISRLPADSYEYYLHHRESPIVRALVIAQATGIIAAALGSLYPYPFLIGLMQQASASYSVLGGALGIGLQLNLLTGLFAFIPSVTAIVTLKLLLRRQPAAVETARCCQCGYLLTGLTSPRCPECGRVV